jgi:Cu/Zn superoxide dismutase
MGICTLEPTEVNVGPLTGAFTFMPSASYPDPNADEASPSYDVAYQISGLSIGEHTYHVHNAGDTYSQDTASAQTNHYIGNTNARPADGPQEVGLLNQGQPVDSDGVDSDGSYTDTVMELNRGNSILGRGMVIHESDYRRSAQCVIGVSGTSATIMADPGPLVKTATCHLKPTTGNAPGARGTVDMFANQYNQLDVHYIVYGLSDGSYDLVVHEWGNIQQPDGSSTGTPFDPIVDGIEQPPITETFTSSNGVAQGEFTEVAGLLNGYNSIAGRSFVVKSGTTILMHGVIGITDQMLPMPHYPVYEASNPATGTMTVAAAVARLSGTGIHGRIEFNQLAKGHGQGKGIEVRYTIKGLTDGAHPIRIHTNGDNSGGVFTGYADATTAGTVGQVDSKPIGGTEGPTSIVSTNGIAMGSFIATKIRLNSFNSVTGRSVVIHASEADTTIVASGAIGVRHYVGAKSDAGGVVVTGAQAALRTPGGASAGTVTVAEGSVTWASLPAGTDSIAVMDAYDTFATTEGVKTVFRGSGTACTSGVGLIAQSGAAASGSNTNAKFTLAGIDSLVGRPVYVFNTANQIVASGVLGRTAETITAPTAEAVLANDPPKPTDPPSPNVNPIPATQGPAVNGATQASKGFALLVVGLFATLL